MSQLQEFNKKSSTNFIRNIRPILQRNFPERYKGKDGNQRLLRDTRYLKISCGGKIPPESLNEKEELDEWIRQGKHKVVKDIGMSPSNDNFLWNADEEFVFETQFDRINVEEPSPNSSSVSTTTVSY